MANAATRVKNKDEAEIEFYDFHPMQEDMQQEVIKGLSQQPRKISPKYFYDQVGSQLFDAICETQEYYPTRTELAILEDNIKEISDCFGEGCLLIEPGSGNSRKVRILLDHIKPCAYMPMDISKAHLREAANVVAQDYPWLDIHAACVDYTAPFEMPVDKTGVRKVAFFPGSTIGNFEPEEATHFLKLMAEMVGEGGGLLIGVDLKKSPHKLNQAYNDDDGFTEAFNLNLLKRLNRELVADFAIDEFEHKAFFNEEKGRVEMHLVSLSDQDVSVAGENFAFIEGDSIHTENSYKYSVQQFQSLGESAGLKVEKVWTDEDELFSVHFFSC